jgi:hypothetical protein
MSWIKRNLLFVIGGLVAAGLLGWAGFYSFSRYQLNADVHEKLNVQYEELNRLYKLKPHPGNPKVDNIAAARSQKNALVKVIDRVVKFFNPIKPVPSGTKVTSEDFAAALRQTIDQLQRDASGGGVLLQPKYSFSFEAERQLVRFAPGSLEPLAVQLGEVKAICDVLIAAKVNSLDSIRRSRISADDINGPLTDYTELPGATNDFAIITPYEVEFRCFSPELAEVISQFAASPLALVVKTINVEPAPSAGPLDGGGMTAAPAYTPYTPAPPPMVARSRYTEDEDGPVRRPPPPTYVAPYASAPASRGGLQPFINERQIRVTLVVEIIKLLPKQQKQ